MTPGDGIPSIRRTDRFITTELTTVDRTGQPITWAPASPVAMLRANVGKALRFRRTANRELARRR